MLLWLENSKDLVIFNQNVQAHQTVFKKEGKKKGEREREKPTINFAFCQGSPLLQIYFWNEFNTDFDFW